MKLKLAFVTAAAVVLMCGGGPALSAHDGHVHTIMGVVTAIDAKHVEVKTPSGEVLSIAVNARTAVLREKRKVPVGDVQVGRRVVVDIGNGEDPLIAREIHVGVAQAVKK